MIGSLRGRLIGRSTTGELLVEVQGLGYRVQAGPATAARLASARSDAPFRVPRAARASTASPTITRSPRPSRVLPTRSPRSHQVCMGSTTLNPATVVTDRDSSPR